MNILLVTPLFPPDTGVSTFRMKFFYDTLAKKHEVDVLKLGDASDFNGPTKTIDRELFSSFFKAMRNRPKISNLLRPLLNQYDLILVSATPYGLFEVAFVAKSLGIPYVLDLRDLPDLTTSEQKQSKPFWWLTFKAWLIDKYIKHIAQSARAVLCAGIISTAITQLKLKGVGTKVVNVHNGFNLEDMRLVRDQSAPMVDGAYEGVVIACVGNIYNFRDTLDLRATLARLNDRSDKITLLHWGKLSDQLRAYVESLPNIKYVSQKPIPRDLLLYELRNVDCFLLPCADDLIWEPTTSVFDYILFDKPVIFTGLRNNEAYMILESTNTNIVKTCDLNTVDFKSPIQSKKNEGVLITYSREYFAHRLLDAIEQPITV